MLQYVAVCCSVSRRVFRLAFSRKCLCVAVSCSMLQCYSVLQCAEPLVMVWLRLVGSLKLRVSFAEYSLFNRTLLQKKPIISGAQQSEPPHRLSCIVACSARWKFLCVTVCCSLLQCVAVFCSMSSRTVACSASVFVCYCVVQYVAVCCSVLQCVEPRVQVFMYSRLFSLCFGVLLCVQYVAVCCSVLSCVFRLACIVAWSASVFGIALTKKGGRGEGALVILKINYFFLFVDVIEWLWWRCVKREGRRERQSERDVYIYIYMRVREIYTYLHICVYICIYLRTPIHVHMYKHLCMDTNKWNCMCPCTIYTHKCVCACLYVHMFVCIYVSFNCIDVVFFLHMKWYGSFAGSSLYSSQSNYFFCLLELPYKALVIYILIFPTENKKIIT